ncbi:MAG TPA: hypothetical protein VG798_00910 [Rhizomicrobium sp.]|nr:hypothetical protein [Rhizomicrobium sp.]HWC63767.1 hypothetical protein [Rhizomicrobium sp.]
MNARVTIFSLTGIPVYIAGYYFDRPLFFYYPEIGHISVRAAAGAGPAIMWFGWLASALLIGVLFSFLVPRRWSLRVPFDLTWMIFIAAFLAVFIYEKRWFF